MNIQIDKEYITLIRRELHNGKMIVNEDVLDVAAKVFVQYVLDRMEA